MGIRLKMLMIFIASVACALVSLTILQAWLSRDLLTRAVDDIDQFEAKYSFFYSLVFMLFTFIFFYLFSRNMIKRIEYINACVNEVRKGNWDIQIHSSSNDEIGNLGRQINTMVITLKELRERELAADRLKTEMIANISHDLRTPVTSLLGYIELMKSNLNDSAIKHQKYLQIAERKCLELKSQIHDLLEYCTINYREYMIQKEQIEMKELLQQVMIDFVPQLEEAEMNFRIQAPNAPVLILVDVKLFVRMLQNIISNAIAYGSEGKKLELYLEIMNEEMVLTLVNYGKEIPKDVLPYIFERFYRGEKSRSTITGGKGMGLAISKSIANLHGGDIEAESSAESTRFTIHIPVLT
ncbi:Sensor histidine kinase YycG [compost metagenome]